MRPGSVLVDLAVDQGGNVEGAKPDEVVVTDGAVKIVGAGGLAGRIAADTSALYAKNLVSLSTLLLSKEGAMEPQWDDEILKAAVVVRDGAAVERGA